MDYLPTLINWGSSDAEIAALLLTGSRAGSGPVDSLSDYDLAVFCHDCRPFLDSEEWITRLASPWVCVHDSFIILETEIATRLTILEGGVKVDFSFFPLSFLNQLSTAGALPPGFDAGYRILLDKGGFTAKLPPPTFRGYRLTPPDQATFTRMEQEFWYEACETVKFLERGDLWPAKHCEQAMRRWLLQLLTWHQAAHNGWDWAPKPIGKHLHTWLDAALQNVIPGLFAGADAPGTRQAIRQMIALFVRLAGETAEQLGLLCREDQARQVAEFLLNRLSL